MPKQHIIVSLPKQKLSCYAEDALIESYDISSGKNGIGEQMDSGCTPRGLHQICEVIGCDAEENTVFVGRVATGEVYNKALRQKYPDRDWILTRILRLKGLEPGFNQGGQVDSYDRYIYIHGTPNETKLCEPASKGCIRMGNQDIIRLANWVDVGTTVFIEG